MAEQAGKLLGEQAGKLLGDKKAAGWQSPGSWLSSREVQSSGRSPIILEEAEAGTGDRYWGQSGARTQLRRAGVVKATHRTL